MSCKYESSFTPQWCPGCGNFDTLECLKKALGNLNIETRDFVKDRFTKAMESRRSSEEDLISIDFDLAAAVGEK